MDQHNEKHVSELSYFFVGLHALGEKNAAALPCIPQELQAQARKLMADSAAEDADNFAADRYAPADPFGRSGKWHRAANVAISALNAEIERIAMDANCEYVTNRMLGLPEFMLLMDVAWQQAGNYDPASAWWRADKWGGI